MSDLNYLSFQRVDLELTPLARAWLIEEEAKANASAMAYLKWLDSLIVGECVELRREAQGDIHLIAAKVWANTMTKVVVVILQDTLLPGGCRFDAGEMIVVSKNIDILISGARRLAPVGGE